MLLSICDYNIFHVDKYWKTRKLIFISYYLLPAAVQWCHSAVLYCVYWSMYCSPNTAVVWAGCCTLVIWHITKPTRKWIVGYQVWCHWCPQHKYGDFSWFFHCHKFYGGISHYTAHKRMINVSIVINQNENQKILLRVSGLSALISTECIVSK